MSDKRPQAKKSAESRRRKQHDDPYMKQESYRSEFVDHSGRRRKERVDDAQWEGVWGESM